MITSILGLVVAFGSILVGNALEGGHLDSLIQGTAALIVFGGTLGATMVATPPHIFSLALRSMMTALLSKEPNLTNITKQLVELATVARKEGVLALESRMGEIKNEFLSHSLRQVVDGIDEQVLVDMMEDTMEHEEHTKTAVVKVWETGGGFAPTVGILGAVLGLIHVMGNLSDSSKLGAGIAVAFVATIYGVGIANLILIPIGNRLKDIYAKEMKEYLIIFHGVRGIQTGLNPRLIESRLNNLAGVHGEAEGEKKAA